MCWAGRASAIRSHTVALSATRRDRGTVRLLARTSRAAVPSRQHRLAGRRRSLHRAHDEWPPQAGKHVV